MVQNSVESGNTPRSFTLAALILRNLHHNCPDFSCVGDSARSLGYMADAAKRSSGFLIAGVAVLGLLVLSIVGIIHAWLVTRPI
jgi:hypothetical protein